MSNKKYCESVQVDWGDVLSLYRKKLNSLVSQGNHYLTLCEKDVFHHFESYVPYDRAMAVDYASQIISCLSELNNLRRFLKYKPFSYSDIKCESLIEFYELNKDIVKPDDFVYPKEPWCYR